ncbi:MAG: hypothetical protein R3F19_26900 [Verrucomicrobiales bacterium]
MSNNSLVKRAMNNTWLENKGVPSLEKQWISIRYPEGPKKKNEAATSVAPNLQSPNR